MNRTMQWIGWIRSGTASRQTSPCIGLSSNCAILAAALVAKTASIFSCDVFFQAGVRECDAKHFMAVVSALSLGPSRIRIRAVGADADEAISELDDVLRSLHDLPGIDSCNLQMSVPQ